MKPLPSVDELFDLFYVDSSSPTGLRYAKARHKCKPGQVAGWLEDRYAAVYINKRVVKAHRVVLKMKTGEDPDLEVDHIDRNARNNHPFNLRWVDRNTNAANTKAGERGVYFNGHSWYYILQRNGKKHYKAGFSTKKQAYDARVHLKQTL